MQIIQNYHQIPILTQIKFLKNKKIKINFYKLIEKAHKI
jgi:hypothetical protein